MLRMNRPIYILLLLVIFAADVAMPPRVEEIFNQTTTEVSHV